MDNKKCAGDNAAPRLVQQPADVNGQLLRFRAGKQHAKIQRVEKAASG